MTRRNRHITLEEAVPGMVLSDDVFDRQGQVLLAGGAVLSEVCIASLRQHNIDTLPILGKDVSDADEIAELKRQEQRLTQLFRKHAEQEGEGEDENNHANQDGATGILRQFVYRFRLGAAS